MDVGAYLALASVLFGIGAAGFVTRSNMLIQLMSIELMLNAVNVALLAFNRIYPSNHDGQIFVFFVIAIAAAEAAVGLGILIAYYRLSKTIETDQATLVKN